MMEDEIDLLETETEEIEDLETEEETPEIQHGTFLKLAQEAYEESESFLEASHKNRWRRNYSLAQSEHPDDSKYRSEAYKHRSRTFRGKTEAGLRKNEAALSVAMFSNRDVVSITPEDRDDEKQEEAAKAIHKDTNHRLDNDIKWFLTVVGAYHEAMIAGDVVSEQYWDYKETEDGKVVVDKPAIDLIPLENVHISPSPDWRDPINSSPYVVVELPMFLGDIKERMKDDWIEHSDSVIKASIESFRHNTIQRSRKGEDQALSSENFSSVSEFSVCYVHQNFIRKEGQDYFYYTLGKEQMLSDPIPVQEAYPHLKEGHRPFVWGTITIEPHKVYRRSMVDRVAGVQAQTNEISNQRFDNVRQVLNKRKYAKRGMGVDYSYLMKSVPGGVVLMDELDAVREEDVSDITSSSYQEQNMINVDFDELAGTFSNASVATNRDLNETVGGMNLLNGNANAMTEYQLRVFVETWVEVVLRQVVDMIVYYEDDDVLQKVVGDNITSDDIQIPIKVRVDVGFGSTDPQQKVQKLVFGLQSVMQTAPTMLEQMDGKEIVKEIFAALGYSDGEKFFKGGDKEEDPKIMELTEQIQQLQQYIETEGIKTDGAIKIEQARGENRIKESLIEAESRKKLKLIELAVSRGMKGEELEAKMTGDGGKLDLEFLKEANRRADIINKQEELSYKKETGNQGI